MAFGCSAAVRRPEPSGIMGPQVWCRHPFAAEEVDTRLFPNCNAQMGKSATSLLPSAPQGIDDNRRNTAGCFAVIADSTKPSLYRDLSAGMLI